MRTNPYATPASLKLPNDSAFCEKWDKKGMLGDEHFKPSKTHDGQIHPNQLFLRNTPDTGGLAAITTGTGNLQRCRIDGNNVVKVTLNHDERDIDNQV